MVLTLTNNCIHLEYLRRDFRTFRYPFYNSDQIINLSQSSNMVEFCIDPVKVVEYFQLGYSDIMCKTEGIDNAAKWSNTQYLLSQNNFLVNSNYDCNNFKDLQAETFYKQPERLSLFAANNGGRVETGVVIFIWLRIHC
ncbi:unnamed protein product [Schistosoma margrebowiei]|uniref:Uncharacterized protein n=1 Tax=Schistosoma margrebowiei TaxID=48269 RepID=A0A183LRJ0_9TREM|nr:unnamed protein product [Schistosoma margrebowiei]